MKITIEAVRPVARPGYKDVLWSGSAKREVDAPVLQFYEMTVTAEDGITRTFETEIRKSCGDGKQVDWSEHLDDFLGTISWVRFPASTTETCSWKQSPPSTTMSTRGIHTLPIMDSMLHRCTKTQNNAVNGGGISVARSLRSLTSTPCPVALGVIRLKSNEAPS